MLYTVCRIRLHLLVRAVAESRTRNQPRRNRSREQERRPSASARRSDKRTESEPWRIINITQGWNTFQSGVRHSQKDTRADRNSGILIDEYERLTSSVIYSPRTGQKTPQKEKAEHAGLKLNEYMAMLQNT